jgi:hypothetical protein
MRQPQEHKNRKEPFQAPLLLHTHGEKNRLYDYDSERCHEDEVRLFAVRIVDV